METSGLDYFLPLISTTDPKMKLSIGAKLLEYLSDSSNAIACSDIGYFVDNLVLWLQCSNFKVVQLDLEILMELINRMHGDFQPYLTTSIPHLVDKLGDSKEVIRTKTLSLLFKLIDCNVISVQNLFDKISVMCFTHKNSNVREQIMQFLTNVLNAYGSSCLYVSKLVPHIVKMLSDPNVSVRSRAFDTLCDIYKHVGEKFRVDLQKKYSIPNNKLPALMAKFDEIKARNSFNSMFSSMSISNGDETDDRGYQFESMTRSAYRPPITPVSASSGTKKLVRKTMDVGAVTEDSFLSSFEDVPAVQIFSTRDIEDNFKKYSAVIEKVNEDWSKRVDCLKKVRSLVIAGAVDSDEFHSTLSLLLPSFLASLKDLRSQVVREACVTIAFLSTKLENKLDRFAESVLINLINLIQNSAKVTSSSGLVCIRFILQNTHAPRLIPIISNSLNSKSKEIRRYCCEFIHLILTTWQTLTIERYVNNVQDAIKKGIMDADSEARIHSRNAFAEFAHLFPDLAEGLKNSLDYSYRKLLLAGSNSGSTTSLSKLSVRCTPRTPSNAFCRSSSAIDSQAAKRAKIRAQYAAIDRQKLMLPKKVASPSEQRNSRTPSRVSISQPTSRSASPSSRISYAHYLESTPRSRRSSTDIEPSRDSNSSRYIFKSHLPVRKPSIQRIDSEAGESCDSSFPRSRFRLDEHEALSADKDSTSYDSGISQSSSADQDIRNYDFPDSLKDCHKLKNLIEELSDASDEENTKEILAKIKSLIQESPSDVIVTHFKLVLGKIISLISESQPAVIKEMALSLLHTIIKRKTVTFLLKQYSDLIIIRVITASGDDSKEVSKAAENCAITLSTHLPPESVIRVVVPLVTSEATAIKLVAIKMLTRVIECSDETVTSSHIDQIMPVLLAAYYDETDSSIRKAAVFAMVALHKQSEEMKILLQPYISQLQGAKLKLFQLYVRRAEQGSSMPTSPRNPF